MATPALAYEAEMHRRTPLQPSGGWSDGSPEATEATHGRA
jgi:hypothetical protein